MRIINKVIRPTIKIRKSPPDLDAADINDITFSEKISEL